MRQITHRIPGLVLTDHTFQVPLDHTRPDGEQITVFAREMVAPEKENEVLPWLVFFQGGPGFGSPRPGGRDCWYKRALESYRVLLLDQRGTGRSTPLNYQSLAQRGDGRAQADYLKHFRADAIVADAELIRCELLGAGERWSGLGQSFGGFCLAHYLSAAPQGLRAAIFTGGLPSLTRPAEDVYRATYRRVRAKNEAYYRRYPDDVARVHEIVAYLAAHEVVLPGGGRLTPHRFQQLGLALGGSDGFEMLHYLLEEAFVDGPAGRELNYCFLRGIENSQHFETNPIFALLHEPIYCQGEAANWAAERVRAEYPEFEIDPERPVLFTGEMIYPWMFDDYRYLQPLKEAAEILAACDDWPTLYDPAVLRANAVPCVAAVYYEDMYVERLYSEETAAAIGNLRIWVTNEYEHNGLRADGDRVLGRLLDMLQGEV